MLLGRLPIEAEKLSTSYDTQDYLGCGSYGQVRACYHQVHGKVAVKCFHISGSSVSQKNEAKMVGREAQFLSRVAHPNIAKLYGMTQWSSNIGIVIEYIRGGGLNDHLENEELNISYLRRLDWCTQITSALAYLHNYSNSRKIIHSDLKPQNILLTKELMIKIIDFGSANIKKITGSLCSTTFDPEIVKQQTMWYTAPERLSSPLNPIPENDVYSFGICLYEIATRKPAYGGRLTSAEEEMLINEIKSGKRRPCLQTFTEVKEQQTQEDRDILELIEETMTQCWSHVTKDRPDIRSVHNNFAKQFDSLKLHSPKYNDDVIYFEDNTVSQISSKEEERFSLNLFQIPYQELDKNVMKQGLQERSLRQEKHLRNEEKKSNKYLWIIVTGFTLSILLLVLAFVLSKHQKQNLLSTYNLNMLNTRIDLCVEYLNNEKIWEAAGSVDTILSIDVSLLDSKNIDSLISLSQKFSNHGQEDLSIQILQTLVPLTSVAEEPTSICLKLWHSCVKQKCAKNANSLPFLKALMENVMQNRIGYSTTCLNEIINLTLRFYIYQGNNSDTLEFCSNTLETFKVYDNVDLVEIEILYHALKEDINTLIIRKKNDEL